MDFITAIQKVMVTYLKTFVAGLFTLFLIIVPSIALFFRNDAIPEVLLGGIVMLFLVPGFICAFVYLPISMIDKKREGLSLIVLIKRYLPFLMIPLVIALTCLLLVRDRDIRPMVNYIFEGIYLVSIGSLVAFCLTVKS